ncbi:hypothetical protein [Nocardioides sp. Root190]|uniref:hypothetical protein n=1 Tax=Nocardioides sp. Root190 TaxID=1736488 RepID=UPI0012FAE776|nr:hypothetical protein [Nocardioides sp. Root190]
MLAEREVDVRDDAHPSFTALTEGPRDDRSTELAIESVTALGLPRIRRVLLKAIGSAALLASPLMSCLSDTQHLWIDAIPRLGVVVASSIASSNRWNSNEWLAVSERASG